MKIVVGMPCMDTLPMLKKKIIITGSVLLVAIVALILAFVPFGKVDSNEKIIQNYLENKDKEYSDEEKTEIVTAYKNLLVLYFLFFSTIALY